MNVYIVNHTHWDREWYKTKAHFSIHLKNGVEDLLDMLDSGEIKNFTFDGQTIFLEDLKELLSEINYKRLIDKIKSGIIEIGPWYVLADEGLLSGEELLDNLDIGLEICEKLGVESTGVAYMPDTFGHTRKLPEIMNRRGIEYAIIHRGLNIERVDCTWQSENGELKTIVLPTREGYYQTMFHKKNYQEELLKYIKEFSQKTSSGEVLILNGCDHTFPPKDFKEKLAAFQANNPSYTIKEVTLSEAFKRLNYNYDKVIEGEFRGRGRAYLLPGVLSTRVYLKQRNRELLDKLKDFYLPVAKLMNTFEQEQVNINNIKKILVSNHAHDSICGCSIDRVHQEMELRYDKCEDLISASITDIFRREHPFRYNRVEENNLVTIYNHTDFTETKDVEINLYALEHPSEVVTLIDDNNNYYHLKVLKAQKQEELFHHYQSEPDYQNIIKVTLKGKLPLRSKTLNTFKVDFSNNTTSKSQLKNQLDNILEKPKLKFKWISDAGDSYNFDPVGEYSLINYKEKIATEDGVIFIYEARVEEYFDHESRKRVGELKPLQIVLKVVENNSDTLSFAKINNIHHNIKVVVAFERKGVIYTDTAFNLEEREEIKEITYDAKATGQEVAYNQFPSLTMIKNGTAFNIHHIGLNEVEVLAREVMMTLFRGVGDLSRRDLKSRKGGAGPSYKTPDAQCKRELNFAFMTTTNKSETKNHLELYKYLSFQHK